MRPRDEKIKRLEGSLEIRSENRVQASYGDAKYERLVKLKTKYDPTNFFRLDTNIAPKATSDFAPPELRYFSVRAGSPSR